MWASAFPPFIHAATPSIQLRLCRLSSNVRGARQPAFKFGSDAISMMFTAAQVAPINLA